VFSGAQRRKGVVGDSRRAATGQTLVGRRQGQRSTGSIRSHAELTLAARSSMLVGMHFANRNSRPTVMLLSALFLAACSNPGQAILEITVTGPPGLPITVLDVTLTSATEAAPDSRAYSMGTHKLPVNLTAGVRGDDRFRGCGCRARRACC
jgi:hypothetical protein